MGIVLSCFTVNDSQGPEEGNVHQVNHCLGFNIFGGWFLDMWSGLSHRQVQQLVPSATQDTAPIRIMDNASYDTYHSPPRPLSFDDPRCSHLHHVPVTRMENASGQCQEEVLHTRESDDGFDIMSPSSSDKLEKYDDKRPLEDKMSCIQYLFMPEDEDVCPICLEEYTSENPRIPLQCSHHFHLSCIYEWMERSKTCPVCGKVMMFDETQ